MVWWSYLHSWKCKSRYKYIKYANTLLNTCPHPLWLVDRFPYCSRLNFCNIHPQSICQCIRRSSNQWYRIFAGIFADVLAIRSMTSLRTYLRKMSLRGIRGLVYSIAFFSCISIVLLRHHLARPTTEPDILRRVLGKPLEKVTVDYKRNIHFSVKTSVKNYRTRLSLLLLTWFQAVEKDQVIT